ncbi:MAG: hypothetical protein D6691_01870 [Candidatus Hydrogenedentota bacterium]|uniref:Uncharacterized protein n=1 Tax=Sumerlaea chitinivorans TaxID=2250252 RepID=A0A2Z4Y807_SUMC1|nr:hypothetical protein BRCON_2376 [Candidatus Sumerlaea chitinivorans]RMH30053.1 MAG: hypothetical protein D6691_01870 [Candidatus Hydrogenedentota bacterium]GIX43961.1 MAG: hypothetical protein KatS3mg130_0369 [Candidatus Sumerlaea sp.]
MTTKRSRTIQLLIVVFALVAVVVWKGQTILSGWEGQVAEIHMPSGGQGNATVVVRDASGRYFNVLLPAGQAQHLVVGAKLVKDRFSLRVRLVELPEEKTPPAP